MVLQQVDETFFLDVFVLEPSSGVVELFAYVLRLLGACFQLAHAWQGAEEVVVSFNRNAHGPTRFANRTTCAGRRGVADIATHRLHGCEKLVRRLVQVYAVERYLSFVYDLPTLNCNRGERVCDI